MQAYLISLAAGLLIGAIYSLLQVRSPAPPIIALVGLLGILAGEQAIPLLRQAFSASPAAAATTLRQCSDHVFGRLSGHNSIEEDRK